MRTFFCLRKDHRAAASGILLVVAVLVAGAMACDGARTYQLAISSTSGGLVATPGEGTYPYGAGIVVQLVATPNEGYEFRSWTGDIATMGDPNAAVTSITMNGNYAIVANFQIEGQIGPDDGGSIGPSGV
jgi:hypothetical protein